MINFVDIPLDDPNYLPEHDSLDHLLSEGWQIIGHAVFTDDAGYSTERYTLHLNDTNQIIKEAYELIEASQNRLMNSQNG